MDEATIKQERSTTKRLLTMAINKLTKSVNAGAPPRTVETKFHALSSRMEQLMEQHAKYLAVKHPDDFEPPTKEEVEWLREVEDQFEEAEQAYARAGMSVSPEQGTSGQEVRKLTRIYQFEIDTAEVMLASLKMAIEDKSSTPASIHDTQADLKSQLDKCRAVLRELFSIADDDVTEDQTASIKELQFECAKAYIEAGRAIEERTETKVRSSRPSMDLKMERMKMPTFSGNIRDYPRFKSEFQKHVAPLTTSEDAAAYLLKSCLEKEALEVVKNVNDDLSKMWERLDDRYGRSSKLVDAIMNEIKQLKVVPDRRSAEFIDLVNTVESCYLDLVRINMQAEICNSTIVSLIEERLPDTVKTTWYLKVTDTETSINEGNKFPEMLEFLIRHKKAMEYGSSNLRSDQTAHIGVHTSQVAREDQGGNEQRKTWCWLHSTSQHSILDCSVFQDMTAESRFEVAHKNRVCFCCLQEGHTSSRCYRAKECSVEGCKRKHHLMLHIGEDVAPRGMFCPKSGTSITETLPVA